MEAINVVGLIFLIFVICYFVYKCVTYLIKKVTKSKYVSRFRYCEDMPFGLPAECTPYSADPTEW